MHISEMTKREREDFYQSKYQYYRTFVLCVVLASALSSITYFISDCQLFGRFAWETLLPRTAIVLPMVFYFLFYKQYSSYKIMVPLSYLMLHLIMWNTIWAIWFLPDKTHASEGFIIMHLMFLAVGFGAPFVLSTPLHCLVIGNILLSNRFNHYTNLNLMLSLGVPCLVGIIAVQYFMQRVYLEHYRTIESIRQQSRLDALTGTHNRNYLHQLVENDSRMLRASLERPVSVLMIDIDYFKKVNDRFGHEKGDRILAATAEQIRNHFPTGEILRWGGEEFVIFLPGTVPAEACRQAEALRCSIEQHKNGICPITVSIGVAPYNGDYQSAVDNADKAMYRAKTSGRNQVQLYDRALHPGKENGAQLNLSGLDDRIFEAFSATSKNRYLYLTNMKTGISRWSSTAVDYFGLPGEYFANAGETWSSFVHPDDRERYMEDIQAVMTGARKVHDLQYRARNRNGEYVAVSCRGVMIKGSDSEPDLFAGTMENHGIINNIDPVTNLYNYYELANVLSGFISQKKTGCLLIIGLTNFETVNELYGFNVGDRVLQTFSARLTGFPAPYHRVYRYNGARFALLLPDQEEKAVMKYYRRLQKIAAEEIRVENVHIHLSLAAGGCRISGEENQESYYRALALNAVHVSEEEKFGEPVFYGDELFPGEQRQIHLLETISHSIIHNFKGFFLCYQPIADPHSGGIVGAEVLLRWRSAEHGVVPPGRFIPWLENEPSFASLGEWILRTALLDTKPFLAVCPGFVLNVNIAYNQIIRPDFRDVVLSALRDADYPAENLCLEITERCHHMEPELLCELVKFMHDQGVRIALDDFGTGAASTSLLLHLPVDEIKIDRSYVSAVMTEKVNSALVDSMVNCADRLGMTVCLEGVETDELRQHLCRSYPFALQQGYFYGKPMEKELFSNLLEGEKVAFSK